MSTSNSDHVKPHSDIRRTQKDMTHTRKASKHSTNMGSIVEHTPKDDHIDCLIVGAGPDGLMASLWMAEFGIKTRIIDNRGTRTLHGMADNIQVRSMEIWESFGMVDTVLKEGFGVNEWCLWGPDEDENLHRQQRKCALGTDLSRFPIGMMHQGHIEATMIDAVRKRSGAEVERGTVPISIELNESLGNDPEAYPVKVKLRRLRREELNKPKSDSHMKRFDGSRVPCDPNVTSPSFEDDHQDIVETVSGEEGSTETVHAKYLIGADGSRSWVRKNLGIDMVGNGKQAVCGAVDLRPISNFPDIRKNCTVRSNDGTLMMVPREKGMIRLYVMFDKDISDDTAFDKIINKAKKIMDPFKFDYSYCDWWTIYRTVQQVGSAYSHKDRVYLTGDAVHTLTPKSGQSMNVSVQDAYNLGWKLAMVLKGHAHTDILGTYERERRPVAKGLIDLDTELAHVLSSKSVDVKAEDTRRIYEHLRDYGSGVNIKYSPSTITVPPIGPPRTNLQVGRRFPSFPVYNQATSNPVEIQQLLKSDGRWRLMVFAGVVSKRLQLERVNALGEQLQEFVHRYPSVKDDKPFLDVLLVHASQQSEVEITDFHNSFFGFDAERGWDYDRVFSRISDGPHSESHPTISRPGLSFGTGCIVVIRPDQHVAWIGRLDEFDLLEEYFEGFMTPRQTSSTEADV